MRPSKECAHSTRPGGWGAYAFTGAWSFLAAFPEAGAEGPVGIPNKLLIAWGIGVVAFIALLAGTSVVRPRAPPADPLVRAIEPDELEETGGSWRREPSPDTAFDDGRELARHAAAPDARRRGASVDMDAFVRQMRALDLGRARVTPAGERAWDVHLTHCASCRNRAWWRKRRGNCAFERGFVTGAFEVIADLDVSVHETKCGGKKDACVFRVRARSG